MKTRTRGWLIAALGAIVPLTTLALHEKRPSSPPRNMFIELSVDRARRTRKAGTDYDDKQQNIKMTVSLYNRNTSQAYNELTGYLYVVAQEVVNRKNYKLILKETETFNLASGQRIQYESGEVRLAFDDHAWAQHGFKYYGHVYIVEDKMGKAILGETTQSKLWDKLEKLAELQPDEEFTF